MSENSEEAKKRFSERMANLRDKFQSAKEKKYIRDRLAENGIDINELECE